MITPSPIVLNCFSTFPLVCNLIPEFHLTREGDANSKVCGPFNALGQVKETKMPSACKGKKVLDLFGQCVRSQMQTKTENIFG